MSTHSLGARRSHPDKLARAKLADRHPGIAILLGQTLPQEYDLEAWAPPIFDQGPTGSCTAHGLAGAVFTALAKAGTPLPWVPSPDGLYKCTRGIARANTTLPSGGLPEFTDGGAELADAIAAGAEWGIHQMGRRPSDGRNSDCDTPTINDEPNLEKLEEAATTLVTGEYRIDPQAGNASDLLAASLVGGFPLYDGFFVDGAFEALTPVQVAPAPNESDPNGGGHATYLGGYRTNLGKREFRLTNSWGDWCDGGRCWVSEAWIRNTWEIWVCDVTLRKGLGR